MTTPKTLLSAALAFLVGLAVAAPATAQLQLVPPAARKSDPPKSEPRKKTTPTFRKKAAQPKAPASEKAPAAAKAAPAA